jgi:hypothetical protein
MTDDRSLERAARSWLEAGPTQAPDRAVEAALLRIETLPQERDLRIPWRATFMPIPARVAAAAMIGVLLVGGAFFMLSPGNRSNVGVPGPSPTAVATSNPTASVSPSPSPSASAADFSSMGGRILVEHLGNALDLSESTATDYNPDKRRFYFMDPADMTSRTVTEFLKGTPATGKSAADVSKDGTKIVFQDWTDHPQIYEANLDGTAFHRLNITCGTGAGPKGCQFLYPDYDPTGTKIVYVRLSGGQSWLEIFDLTTNATTKLASTASLSLDDVPEQPAWSPDGKTIAYTTLHWAGRNDPVVGTVRYGDQPPASGKLLLVNVATDKVTPVTLPAGELPGDVNWAPDSATLVYTSNPASTTGSDSGMPAGGGDRQVRTDGTGFRHLPGWGGPEYLPDGQHILYQDNELWLMNPDGTDAKRLNPGGMDLSDLAQGFAYIAHWVPSP